VNVLVCGGRDFEDIDGVFAALDIFHRTKGPITTIIEGGARGADLCAMEWARARKVRRITVRADWATFGKAAGPIRNQRIIDEFRPDVVLVFPGGRGTADMMRRAKDASVPVIEYTGPERAAVQEGK